MSGTSENLKPWPLASELARSIREANKSQVYNRMLLWILVWLLEILISTKHLAWRKSDHFVTASVTETLYVNAANVLD